MTVEYPLSKAHRIRLARAFRLVPCVDLSIDCAIEGQMGRAFVHDGQVPQTFRIDVGPSCYLAGDPASAGERAVLEDMPPYTLLMRSTPGWLEAVKAMYGDG